jgi:hypothetical protein
LAREKRTYFKQMENEMNDLSAIIEKMGEFKKNDAGLEAVWGPLLDDIEAPRTFIKGANWQHQQNEKVRLALIVAVEALDEYEVICSLAEKLAKSTPSSRAKEQIKKILESGKE